jgi:hypothetical protein
LDNVKFELRNHLYNFPKLERINGEPRLYKTPGGAMLPSVTSVTGLTTKDGIVRWRKRVGEEEANKISRSASGRGTAVHNLIEKYVTNDTKFELAYKKAMPNTITLFNSLKKALNNVTTIHALETSIWSDYLKVAGTVDCIALYEGELCVIDFKTSSKPKREEWIENYFMQTAAYACAWYERTNEPINNLVVLVANDYDGDVQIFKKTTYPYLMKFKQARLAFHKQYGV